MYSEKVMEHFSNPRNVGDIEDADGVGTVGNPVCGDLMTIYIKVKDNIIEDIKFKTFGCGAAIATSSMVTEGWQWEKTIEEALAITRDDVADELEGLPPVKMHCSNLAADALHAALMTIRRKLAENANSISSFIFIYIKRLLSFSQPPYSLINSIMDFSSISCTE